MESTTPAAAAVSLSSASRSSPCIEIIKALSKFQSAITSVDKDRANEHFKQNYSTLDAFWKIARPAMEPNGLALIQTIEAGSTAHSLILRTTLFHTSGEWIESVLPLPIATNARNAMQELGSAITYAKRYAMAAMLGMTSATDESDDDGNKIPPSNQKPPNRPTSPPKPQGPANTPPAPAADPRANMLKALAANAKKKGWSDDQVASYIGQRYHVPKFANLKVEQCSELITAVGKWTPEIAFNELALANQSGPPGETNFETDVPG